MFSSNSSNVATPISDLSNESLIIPEEIDFLRAFVPGIKMEKQLLSVDTAQANGLHLTPLIRKPTFLTENLRFKIKLAYVIMSHQTFLFLP